MANLLRDDFFAKGADVGWLQQMEATGYTFYDALGNPRDCLEILKEHGINSIRLRVWVNPNDDPRSGHNSIEEVAIMAERVKKMGFRLMINFHYSDSWADPGKQYKPKAWEGHNAEQLEEDVYNHTFCSLTLLKNKGIDVDWVQVGNEITNGMLWPEGHIINFEQLTRFINSGYRAVKEVFPDCQVIVHLDSGHDSERYTRFFEQLTSYNGKYDMIGMSYYPWWAKTVFTQNLHMLESNINELVNRYDKDVMITEIGGLDTEPHTTYRMIREVIEVLKAVPNNRGRGVFYWEPQGAANWSGYRLSAWGKDGRPTKALSAFMD
ncbi:MAG: arabinogalactan endo-1,4-beta-galactosidase [Clostridiales bacterium]|nr:arabinogalactan endo-1,4-beta-galactosidase [Clostridiales bacterium]